MSPWVLIWFLMDGPLVPYAVATSSAPMAHKTACFKAAEMMNAKTDVRLRAMCVQTGVRE